MSLRTDETCPDVLLTAPSHDSSKPNFWCAVIAGTVTMRDFTTDVESFVGYGYEIDLEVCDVSRPVTTHSVEPVGLTLCRRANVDAWPIRCTQCIYELLPAIVDYWSTEQVVTVVVAVRRRRRRRWHW